MAENVTQTQTPPAAPAGDFSGILAGVKQQFAEQFKADLASAIKPLTDRQEALEQKLSSATAPQKNASQLFGGGAPAIRQGENPLASRGYSFGRLMFAMASRNFEDCKLELDMHNRLMQRFGGELGKGSILVPMGGAHLSAVDADLARESAQLMRQGVAGADLGEIGHMLRQRLSGMGVVRQDLSTLDDLLGGYLLGPTEQGDMIALLRANEIFSQAGATDITLPPNGRMQWPRHTGATTGYWVGETSTITASNQTFGMLTMVAKKLAALVNMPNEALRFLTPSIEAFARTEIARTLGLKLDSTALSGTSSSTSPTGILNTTGINSYTATTTGTNGDTLEPEDIDKMVGTVADQNVDVNAFKFVMRPLMWSGLATRRADAVTAGDAKGRFMFDPAETPGLAIPKSLRGNPVLTSTQIPNDRVKAAGTNLTLVLGGVFSECLIGRVGVLEFTMDPYAGASGTNFVQDVTSLRAIQHVDVAFRRPEAFIYCDTLING